MKVYSKLLIKIVSTVITVAMLMIPFSGIAFAADPIGDIVKSESLADSLDLGKDETADVIVKFTSPSLLELKVRTDGPYAASYEKKLLSEQDAILHKLGIVSNIQIYESYQRRRDHGDSE